MSDKPIPEKKEESSFDELYDLYSYFNGEELEVLLGRYETARVSSTETENAVIRNPEYEALVRRMKVIETVIKHNIIR